MVLDYFLSFVIGFVGAVLIITGWVSFEILKVKNRCAKVAEIVLLSLKSEGNIKILPWYCTKEFIDSVEVVQKQIHQMGDIITADAFKIQLMKHSDYTLNVVIGFKLTHENGVSNVQAIMHKRPSRVMVHQVAIF